VVPLVPLDLLRRTGLLRRSDPAVLWHRSAPLARREFQASLVGLLPQSGRAVPLVRLDPPVPVALLRPAALADPS